ncbi:hypothetical protein SRHO_G00038520 [Serrasalmus rhombeus]
MMTTLEEYESHLKKEYESLRALTTPSQDIRRRMDSCTSVTKDVVALLKMRCLGKKYDAAAVKESLCKLLQRDDARSIYGSTVSRAEVDSVAGSQVSIKKAEAAARLASKRAEINRESEIAAQRKEVLAQQEKLKMLEHQRDLEAMQAEYDVYAEEETKMSAEVRERKEITSSQPRHNTAPCAQILYGTLVPPHSEEQSEQKLNEATLVQAFKESLMMTRLPAPEPSVFTGDPLAFTEWQTSFKALIETTCTSPAHRLFYLRKYISGDALSVLEGTFYRSDEEAYTQAWDALNKRYGHPFIVQRAFRGKLGSWPKIGPKEPLRLREFSDFLVSCKNAMPHISGLKVLDDCEENQKLLQKLPDWATARWNRLVTKELDDGKPYPSFEVFSNFLSEEARIACNPVSSLHALKRTEEKAGTEAKRIKTRILVTTTRVAQGKGHPSKDSDTQSSNTFVTEEVCDKLEVHTEPVKLKLSTMTDRSIVNCLRASGLKVRGYSSKECIELPPAYTREDIPLEKTSIPTWKTAKGWTHLLSIADEMPDLLDCPAGLLIGYDCVRALKPKRVVSGAEHEPYAVKTDLGWSVVGAKTPTIGEGTNAGFCYRISLREIPPITPACAIKALERDFQDTNPTEGTISQEDIQFLQILNEGIYHNDDGHLEMPLPFRKRPQLPNNKHLATVRLKHLKRKMDKNPKYKEDYVQFMVNVFKDEASHRGGIWERQIRTTRSVMSSVLAQAKGKLDDSSLRTFFYEAMFIVNSRPLTTNTLADPKSIEPLTPNHLLTMKPTTPLPPPGRFVQEDLYAQKRWRKVQYLSEQFWSRWRREYLTNISLRQQWHTTRRNVQVGDIVIVKDENTPRNEWPLSKVVEAQEDDDGLVRKVKIQVGQNKLGPKGERLTQPSFLERPVQKLVVLVEHK